MLNFLKSAVVPFCSCFKSNKTFLIAKLFLKHLLNTVLKIFTNLQNY